MWWAVMLHRKSQYIMRLLDFTWVVKSQVKISLKQGIQPSWGSSRSVGKASWFAQTARDLRAGPIGYISYW